MTHQAVWLFYTRTHIYSHLDLPSHICANDKASRSSLNTNQLYTLMHTRTHTHVHMWICLTHMCVQVSEGHIRAPQLNTRSTAQYTHKNAYIYVFMYAYINIFICIQMCKRMCVYIYICSCWSMHTFINMHAFSYEHYLSIDQIQYTYLYTCIYTYMHVYIYIWHTYYRYTHKWQSYSFGWKQVSHHHELHQVMP